MKKKHLVTLVRTIKDILYAHRKADWEDKVVLETVAEVYQEVCQLHEGTRRFRKNG